MLLLMDGNTIYIRWFDALRRSADTSLPPIILSSPLLFCCAGFGRGDQ